MAKRRDELLAVAEHRNAGAKDLTLRTLRGLAITLGDTQFDREAGVVTRMHSSLCCQVRVAGILPIVQVQSLIYSDPGLGVAGELARLAVALKDCLEQIQKAYDTHLCKKSEADNALDDGLIEDGIEHRDAPQRRRGRPTNEERRQRLTGGIPQVPVVANA